MVPIMIYYTLPWLYLEQFCNSNCSFFENLLMKSAPSPKIIVNA